MRFPVRSLFVICTVLIGLPLSASGATLAAGSPRLIDQRSIELPDSRLIAISPNGLSLAASDMGMDHLCIYDVETLTERVCADLEPLDAGLRIEDVVWSPDSTKLALAEQSFLNFVDGDLWVMDATTGELTDLTDDGVDANIPLFDKSPDFSELFLDVSPIWLPDGSGVTFSRTVWRDGDFYGNTIQTVPLTGGEPKLLTIVTLDTPGVVYFGMRWTADGSKLIYSVNPPDSSDPTNGIWSVNADGLGAKKLVGVDPELGTPIVEGISPSGDTVLVYYPMAAGAYDYSNDYVYAILDVASGELAPIVPQADGAPEYISAMPAVLSPDGQFVLYASRLTGPDHQVYLRPVDGGPETPLVPDGLPAANSISLTAPISWASDGTVLLNGATPSEATLLTIEGVSNLADSPPSTAEGATPVPISAADQIATGTTVTVNDNDVPLRSAPSTSAQTVATLSLGTELTVVGPAVEADGFIWIPVTDPETGVIGYVRSEFIEG